MTLAVAQEDAKLTELVEKYGPCNWTLISQVSAAASWNSWNTDGRCSVAGRGPLPLGFGEEVVAGLAPLASVLV